MTLCKRAWNGVDIVSLGEYKIAIENGVSPSNIIFSGVGKTEKKLNIL